MEKMKSVLILLGVISLLLSINPENALSDVDIHIGIGLPTLVISSPPVMVVIPGTYVYYPPDVHAELFFYHGYWYRPYGGIWYRATVYNGPWVRIEVNAIPGVVLNVPRGYRNIPPGHQRIPYGQLKKNWRTWESQKYWDKPGVGPKGGGGPKMKEGKEPGGPGKGWGKGKGRSED